MRTVSSRKFRRLRAKVPTVPVAAVEHFSQPCVPDRYLFLREGAVQHRLERLSVALGADADIFGRTGAPFDFEDACAAMNHLVEKADRFEILRTHHVLRTQLELDITLDVSDCVFATARLQTLTSVGAFSARMQTHEATAALRDAQSSMAEDFNAYGMPRRSADVLGFDGARHGLRLIKRKLTSQHRDVGKACVELQRLNVGDIELRRQVHRNFRFVRNHHRRDIRADDGVDACGFGSKDAAPRRSQIVVVEHCIHG